MLIFYVCVWLFWCLFWCALALTRKYLLFIVSILATVFSFERRRMMFMCIGLVWAAKLYACSFSHQITCGQDRIESWTPPVQIGMTALRETFCSSCIYDWWIRISTDRWCMRINFQPMNAQVMCGLKSKNLYIDRNFFCMHTRWSIHKKWLHFDWNGYTSVTEWWIFFISIIKKHKDKR